MGYLNIIRWMHVSTFLQLASIYSKLREISLCYACWWWPVDDGIVQVVVSWYCWLLDRNHQWKIIYQYFSGGTILYYFHCHNSFSVSNLIHRLFLATLNISNHRQNLIVQMQDNHRLDICNEKNHRLNGEMQL